MTLPLALRPRLRGPSRKVLERMRTGSAILYNPFPTRDYPSGFFWGYSVTDGVITKVDRVPRQIMEALLKKKLIEASEFTIHRVQAIPEGVEISDITMLTYHLTGLGRSLFSGKLFTGLVYDQAQEEKT